MTTIKAIKGGTHTVVLEETVVTRYVALAETAGGFTVPGPDGSSDRHFFGIEFPGVTETASVIYYRTRHTGRPTFTVRINHAQLSQYTFTDQDPPERTWHEIIPADVPPSGPTLMAQNNELIFGVSGQGAAVTFGDVVIFYTSNETTISLPIVLKGD
jgi:hypothetical protein